MKNLGKFKFPILIGTLIIGFVAFQNFTPNNIPPTVPIDEPTPIPGFVIPFPSGHSFSIAGSLPQVAQSKANFTFTTPSNGELKVKINAMGAIYIPSNCGYCTPIPQFNYGCMSVQVTVNGVTKDSSYLRVPGVPQSPTSKCLGSPESIELSFPNVSSPVSVSLAKVKSDNCKLSDRSKYGCALSYPSSTDFVNGIVEFYKAGSQQTFEVASGATAAVVPVKVNANPYSSLQTYPVKLRVKPTPASNLASQYGCASVDVKVNAIKINSGVLKVEGVPQPPNSVCANAPTEKVIEFSSQFAPPNSTLQVIVENGWYDRCNGPYGGYGCAMSATQNADKVSGRIDFAF